MREKINSLQGLRVLAMIIVFLYHCGLFPFGHLAVTFFFTLSGFVSYYSNSEDEKMSLDSNIKYFKSKIKKFYVIYLLVTILGLIANYNIFNTYNLGKKILIILSNITLTQTFIPNTDYYFSFIAGTWYMSSLAFCYLVFNIYKYYLNKSNIKEINIIVVFWILEIIVSLLIINLSSDIIKWIIYINPISRSINFLMGMLLAKIFINKNKKYVNYNIIETAICIAFIFIYIGSIFVPRVFIWSTYYSPIIMIIIYIFSFQEGWISKIFMKNIFVKLSKISFEFYMIHQLVINICWKIIKSNNLIISIISLIVSLILATILNKISVISLKQKEVS